MKKKSKLRLVEPREEVISEIPLKDLQANSFWNTCGKHQDRFPCLECSQEAKIGEGWSIKSPENDNCFWQWVKKRTFPDGFMNPLSQAETAKLLGCSPTSVHMIEKAALAKLKSGPYMDILKDYLTEEPGNSNPTDFLVTIPITDLEAELDNMDDE